MTHKTACRVTTLTTNIAIILGDIERQKFEWVARWFTKIDKEVDGMLYGVRYRVRKDDENPDGVLWYKPHSSHLSTQMLLWYFEDLSELFPRVYVLEDYELRMMLLSGLIERLEQNINLRGATEQAAQAREFASVFAMLPIPV